MTTPSPTDREAEAALLALGSQLEWTTDLAGRCIGKCGDGRGANSYTIEPPAPRSPFYQASMTWDSWGFAPNPFNTIIAAKAACERHYATGKWD
jgi:hypothetical protein